MFESNLNSHLEYRGPLLALGRDSTANADLLGGGGAIAALESRIAEHYGAKHVLCVASATAGLLATALALDLRDADFITTPYTFGASLSSWLAFGNCPVFADIDPDLLTLDPRTVRQSITRKTKAILAVDIFGNPSDSQRLKQIATELGLWYIADSAQAFGATRSGQPASCHADAWVLSFTSGKMLDAGEGGAIITNNTDLYEKLLWVSQHPHRQKRELGLGVFNEFSLNARMHPLGARLALAAFDRALNRLAQFQAVYFDLIEWLETSGLSQHVDYETDSIRPSFFCLTVAPAKGVTVNDISENLSGYGQQIKESMPPVSLIYQNPVFVESFKNRFRVPRRCVVAERAGRRIALKLKNPVSLPGDDL